MKKLLLLAGVASLLIFTGCSSKQEPEKYDYKAELKGAPEWVLNENNDTFTAVGSAKINMAGLGFAEIEATGVAKDKITRQIHTKTSSVLKNFVQVTGSEGKNSIDKVVTNTTRQLSKQDIYGAKIKQKWISDTGTLWVLVKADSAGIKNTISDEFSKQQELAKEAQQELDQYIDKEFR